MNILKDFEAGQEAWIHLKDDDEQSLSSLDYSSILSAEDSSDEDDSDFYVNSEKEPARTRLDGMHSLPNLLLEEESESSKSSHGLIKKYMSSSSTKKSYASSTTLRSRWNDVMDSSLVNDQWSLRAMSRPKQSVRLLDIRKESATRADLEVAFQSMLRAKSPVPNTTNDDKIPVSPLRTKSSLGASKLLVDDDKSPETPCRQPSMTRASNPQTTNTSAPKRPTPKRVIRCRTAEASPFPSNPRSNKFNTAIRPAHTVVDEVPIPAFRRSTKTIDASAISASDGTRALRRSSITSCGAEAEGGAGRRSGLRMHLVKKDSCPSLVYRTRSGQDDLPAPGRHQKLDSCPNMVQRRISGDGVEMEEQMGVRRRRGNRRRNFQKMESCPQLAENPNRVHGRISGDGVEEEEQMGARRRRGNRRRNFEKMDSCPQLVERKHSDHSKELIRDIAKLTKPRAMKTKRSCEMLSNRQQEEAMMPDLMEITGSDRRNFQDRRKKVGCARKRASYTIGQRYQERNMPTYQERSMLKTVDLMGCESDKANTGMLDTSNGMLDTSEISRSIRGRTITFMRREMASVSERSTNHNMAASGHTLASSAHTLASSAHTMTSSAHTMTSYASESLNFVASEHSFACERLEKRKIIRNCEMMLSDSRTNNEKMWNARIKSDNMLFLAKRASLCDSERNMLRNPELLSASDRLEECELLGNPDLIGSDSERSTALEIVDAKILKSPEEVKAGEAKTREAVTTIAAEEKPSLKAQEKKNLFSSITDDTLSILRAGALGRRLPISNKAA